MKTMYVLISDVDGPNAVELKVEGVFDDLEAAEQAYEDIRDEGYHDMNDVEMVKVPLNFRRSV